MYMKTQSTFLRMILLVVLVNTISVSINAQDLKFKLADLIDKPWCMQGLTNQTYVENYLSNKVIGKLVIDKEPVIAIHEYYLSDSIVKVFDKSKVGGIKEGKYLVIRPLLDMKNNPNQPQPVNVFEILELTGTSYKIKKVGELNVLEFKVCY